MNIVQAKDLQAKVEAAQAELAALEVVGRSGAGLVAVTLNGRGEMRKLAIDPSLLKPEEGEIVEDLVVAAHQDAKSKAEAAAQEKMRGLAGGLPLPPGLKLF